MALRIVALAALFATAPISLAYDGAALTRLKTGASCEGCDLRGADLRGLALKGASLARSDLRGANLAGVDLAGANLDGAVLAGALLRGARLDAASMVRARLDGADLSGAMGLVQSQLDATCGEPKSVRLPGALTLPGCR